jgi:ABC-type Fe3+-siderophore transport system permease subunit
MFGAVWLTMTGIQTKLLIKTRTEWFLFGWAGATSLLWCYLVRHVVISPEVIPAYALGTAIGAIMARRVGSLFE